MHRRKFPHNERVERKRRTQEEMDKQGLARATTAASTSDVSPSTAATTARPSPPRIPLLLAPGDIHAADAAAGDTGRTVEAERSYRCQHESGAHDPPSRHARAEEPQKNNSMALARHAAVLVALVLAGAWTSFVDLVEAHPASSGASTSSSSSSTVRLCGPRLVDLVWMLCMDRGGVHSHMDRRALGAPRARPQQPFVIYRPSLPRPDGQEDEDSGSSERGTTATSIAANTYHHSSGHSNGGGIVDECCRKACSFATLASYCARPSAGSSLDAFNMLLASPADEARSSESAMQGDQAVEPTTEAPSPVESHVQHAQEVNREHNEVYTTFSVLYLRHQAGLLDSAPQLRLGERKRRRRRSTGGGPAVEQSRKLF
ncbi:hypothetical protein HPB47_024016 [Ixodes persulcatus]|uniref:Uncharacterized protein n=1 Tax=Ixodes persulcatus TaxID=34615 RepID=A0AC60Q5S2_IXOPE|nr:hypothetical protein HPB47_024016 [Ixodes persulcatus]